MLKLAMEENGYDFASDEGIAEAHAALIESQADNEMERAEAIVAERAKAPKALSVDLSSLKRK